MNLKLYYNPDYVTVEGEIVNEDLYQQLNFLEERLHKGEGQKMQELFPEGYVFINVLYGLSWCNFLTNVSRRTDLYRHGLQEVEWAYQEVTSPRGKEIFDQGLPLEYGAFYTGWSTYLLGMKLSITEKGERGIDEIRTFKESCEMISTALKASSIPYLESYDQLIWPADMFTCILSLQIHDEILDDQYSEEVNDWLEDVQGYLDPDTGLIPHSVHPDSGFTFEGARGSSQSLMLAFLHDIDKEIGREQYDIYKSKFLASRFGLPGIREYPIGKEGAGDVDSGPVILGIGGSASIVGQRAAGKYEDWDLYSGLRNCIELFGVPQSRNNSKEYVLGELPMADAFIAWSNSIEYSRDIKVDNSNWRWRFQLLSILLITGMFYILVKL